VIEYRAFRNFDPPQILRLWEQAGLGHGAAQTLSNDMSFDMVNYAQTYFDRQGLILAVDSGTPVGFVHAGFGCSADGNSLDNSTGVICVVVVHPEYRRRGIGRELVSRAESYLKQKGATRILAGPARKSDPFYFGLYGGARPAGFLLSDKSAEPFFTSLGYEPSSRYAITSRQMSDRDPVHFRSTMIRRKWELMLVDRPEPCSWWWMCRYGRLDSVYCVLVPKAGGATPVAGVTIVGLDAYARSWHEQAIGLVDLWVDEKQRGQGFGQALLLEVVKRLRKETVTRLTANVGFEDVAAKKVFESVGFSKIDEGVVYQLPAWEPESTKATEDSGAKVTDSQQDASTVSFRPSS
jgi:ribosomal protein S18 acetylase RimI-like enzyme